MWQVVLFNVTNGLIIGAFYVLMAVVLLLRPRGLFGEEGMLS